MAAKTLLQVITQDKVYFKQDVDMVIFDGQDGQLGVLPGHAPLTVALRDLGVLRAVDGENEYAFYIAGGFAKISAEQVMILTEAAQSPEEIDRERAERAKAEAETALNSTHDATEQKRYAFELRKANVRLDVSSYPIVKK